MLPLAKSHDERVIAQVASLIRQGNSADMLECAPGAADQSIAALSAELIGLLAEVPWPLALVSSTGKLLALSTPLRDLLGPPAEGLLDSPFESLFLDEQQLPIRALLD